MNFRGSTGYGRKFWEASFKQWGKKMQDDVTDGVKYAISAGHRRSEAHLHLWRQLRRLLRARRTRVYAGTLRLRRRLRRRVEPVHVPQDHSAVLEAAARHVLRDGRQSRNRQGAVGRGIAGAARRQHPRAAVDRARRAGPARQYRGIQSDGGGAEEARHRRSNISSRRTRATAFTTRRTASNFTKRWSSSWKSTCAEAAGAQCAASDGFASARAIPVPSPLIARKSKS